MKVIELPTPGTSNFLHSERPTPVIGPHEVLVRLHAASLNYIDLPVALGQLPWASFPLVPVTDGAGEVEVVGSEVREWKAGDRVIPHFMPHWHAGPIHAAGVEKMRGLTLQGSLAEYVAVPAASLVSTPQHLTDTEAATLPIAATTAWNAFKAAQVRPGSKVLLLGSGGVSTFLLKLAKAAGAHVTVVSSEAKAPRLLELGADAVVDRHRYPEWQERYLELTSGSGADLILETVMGPSLQRSVHAAAFGGTIFVIGFLGGQNVTGQVLPILQKALRVVGNNTGSVQDLREVAIAISTAKLKPTIAQTFGSDDARAAYEQLQGGAQLGKLALHLQF